MGTNCSWLAPSNSSFGHNYTSMMKNLGCGLRDARISSVGGIQDKVVELGMQIFQLQNLTDERKVAEESS